MARSFTRFIGVDLGGGRGKTTAFAELRMAAAGGAEVVEVATRAGRQPWTDDNRLDGGQKDSAQNPPNACPAASC